MDILMPCWLEWKILQNDSAIISKIPIGSAIPFHGFIIDKMQPLKSFSCITILLLVIPKY